ERRQSRRQYRRHLRGLQEKRRHLAPILRLARGALQRALRPLPAGDEGHGKVATGTDRSEGYRAARDGGPQAEPGRGRGRGDEPLARPVHRASGEGEPQETRREAPRRWAAPLRRRARNVQVLPQRVARLFLYLRARARAARHPPRRLDLRRGHGLRPPAPGLQGPHEPVL
ncbi:MAG: hypothetical protein AVDCRST_MAG01-01-490, partial [uncultured Rubrobacteraceae bacterium]